MPEVSPRRSSRARAVQPPPNKFSHNNSSSSNSSSRGERSIKDNHSHERVADSLSANSDETEQFEQETRQTRRQKREQEAALDPKPEINVENEEDEDGEEEVTRCICGKLEYPGPPRPSGDRRDTAEIQDPDAGGMFIQCDVCKVWQHGGCVGIMDEASTPDNYYCEQCKPSFHKIMTGGRAQKYSRYLPVVEGRGGDQSRKKGSGREPDSRSSKEADSKISVHYANGKRRSTMNSRAAYDEEEVFRRVLEESKGNNEAESSASGNRKGKRTRDDSEESDHDLKRRKTGSNTPPEPSAMAADIDSDNELSRSRSKNNGSKSRSSKSQAEQEREFRRREKEREQERQAAANRRKGRADRRRADEAEALEDAPRPQAVPKNAAIVQAKASRGQATSRQQNLSPPRAAATSHKKNARPARRGKVGRNQYTRDRDAAADARAEAARALHSRDGEDNISGENNNQLLPNGSKPAKPKHMNPNRTSMNELRKRAAGILEYISRTQVEMAGERTPSGSQTPSKSSSRAPAAKPLSANGASKLSNEVHGDDNNQAEDSAAAAAAAATTTTEDATAGPKVEVEAFKKMGTLQMMDVLTREIFHWQQQHGKWGEK